MMLDIASLPSAITSAVILAIVGQNARNMLQTVKVRNQLPMPNPLLQDSKDTANIVEKLKTMKRKELLEVFSNARGPTPSELGKWFSCKNEDEYSEWDGETLDNNGKVMNGIANFIIYQLFGGSVLPWSKPKGRWSGKAFKPTGNGINIFSNKKDTTFLRHRMDWSLQKSRVLKGKDNSVLRLDYAKYQSLPISLWCFMHDELRVVHSDGEIVMIGIGYVDCLGGSLNCSPFFLVKRK